MPGALQPLHRNSVHFDPPKTVATDSFSDSPRNGTLNQSGTSLRDPGGSGPTDAFCMGWQGGLHLETVWARYISAGEKACGAGKGEAEHSMRASVLHLAPLACFLSVANCKL